MIKMESRIWDEVTGLRGSICSPDENSVTMTSRNWLSEPSMTCKISAQFKFKNIEQPLVNVKKYHYCDIFMLKDMKLLVRVCVWIWKEQCLILWSVVVLSHVGVNLLTLKWRKLETVSSCKDSFVRAVPKIKTFFSRANACIAVRCSPQSYKCSLKTKVNVAQHCCKGK